MDCRRTGTRIDFFQYLDTAVTLYIMSFLNDPADLVRAISVSRIWRQFVITHGLAKDLCLKALPQLSSVSIANASSGTINPVQIGTNAEEDWETLSWDQNVYASLLYTLTESKIPPKDCITTAVCASSTDNYPDEGILNTLSSRDSYMGRPSYWSSKGQKDPEVPETLIYKLRPCTWVISEIDIQPFEAFFQLGSPIYSAKSVRFRLGHARDIGNDLQHMPMQSPADDMFVWTYTSPEFPMAQENQLQSFKLPKPVLCSGGYLLIELLGRVQKQAMDGLFYICVCYVQVMGRPLSPAFEIHILKPDGEMMLTYQPAHLRTVLESPPALLPAPQVMFQREEVWWQRMDFLDFLVGDPLEAPRARPEGQNVEILEYMDQLFRFMND